ncbi:hypothetical protein N7G274_007106 [Stereocaulon virgatum]|uniref:RING-type domain-containing protein n=1 Tax=Stereocaulon virgatum TaxID=373712 RepID=A0ABR4A560_9LECA
MAHLGGPATRPSKVPQFPTCAPVDVLLKPTDLAHLSNVQELKKARWTEGVTSLWHVVDSSTPGSAAYKNAYIKLVRITNAVKEAYDKHSTASLFTGPNDSTAPNGYEPEAKNAGLRLRPSNTSKSGESSIPDAGDGKRAQRMNLGDANLATKEFVNLAEVPDCFINCDLCNNAFSIEELAGQGFTVYPVRLPVCGHICCYDCARMYISHSRCPDCDTNLGEPTQALAFIDQQIQKSRQYLVASFNDRLQNGLIQAPPGSPILGPEEPKESISMTDEYDDDETISDGVSEPNETDVSAGLNGTSTPSDAVPEQASHGTWRGINTIPEEDLEATYTLLDMRYQYSTPSPYRT